jgi:hypothetical protein
MTSIEHELQIEEQLPLPEKESLERDDLYQIEALSDRGTRAHQIV